MKNRRDQAEGVRSDETVLYIVRHGETDWNARGRIQGVSDTPLNGAGREQARRVAERFAEVSLAAVYASDLVRAVDTARAICARAGAAIDGEPDLGPRPPLKTTPALREIAYGEWEGCTRKQLEAAGWGRALRRWNEGLPTRLPRGAETREEAAARVDRFLASVTPRHPGEAVAVVGHGGTLRLMLCRLLGWPTSRWGRVRIANTGVSEAVLAPGTRPRVSRVNSTSHLQGMARRGGRALGPLNR